MLEYAWASLRKKLYAAAQHITFGCVTCADFASSESFMCLLLHDMQSHIRVCRSVCVYSLLYLPGPYYHCECSDTVPQPGIQPGIHDTDLPITRLTVVVVVDCRTAYLTGSLVCKQYLVNDGALHGLDSDRRLIDPQHTTALTGGRAHSAGELWEVVGLKQAVQGFLPPPLVY